MAPGGSRRGDRQAPLRARPWLHPAAASWGCESGLCTAAGEQQLALLPGTVCWAQLGSPGRGPLLAESTAACSHSCARRPHRVREHEEHGRPGGLRLGWHGDPHAVVVGPSQGLGPGLGAGGGQAGRWAGALVAGVQGTLSQAHQGDSMSALLDASRVTTGSFPPGAAPAAGQRPQRCLRAAQEAAHQAGQAQGFAYGAC